MIVDIAEHALKHGLSEFEIRYAWENFLIRQNRETPFEDHVVSIGVLPSGDLVQMVAVATEQGTLVYHAMKPPTKKVLSELGFDVRGRRC